MPAAKGNTYAKRFDTKKERQELCQAWCDHRSAGYSKESFPMCDKKTVNRVMNDHPEDFPTIKIAEANQSYRYFWENIGMKGMKGEIPNFNSTVWIFNMKNRFNWTDKREDTIKTPDTIKVVYVKPKHMENDE